jgi:hypothetical protein
MSWTTVCGEAGGLKAGVGDLLGGDIGLVQVRGAGTLLLLAASDQDVRGDPQV